MSRLIGTGAVSLLFHGGLALALLGLPRGDSVVPPRVLHVVLPAFDVVEARPPDPARGASEETAAGRGVDARAGRPQNAPTPGAAPAQRPRRAERGEDVRMQVDAAISASTHSTPSGEDEPVQSDQVRERAARPEAITKAAQTTASVSEPRASGMEESRASLEAARDAIAAGGVAGISAAGPNSASSVGGASSSEDPLDSGTGTRARGLDPGSARGAGGGAVASIPGPGDGMGALARPRYSDNPRPAYPWSARVRGEEGTVLLAVHVDARGRVSDLRVERSSGSRALDEAATAAVRQWTFHPGVRATEPVNSWVRVPLRFQLRD